MTDPTDAQIARMNWCDHTLRAISWTDDGRDLVLEFQVPPADRRFRVTCRWVRGLRVTLEFPADTGGGALSWEGAAKRTADGAWNLAIDFASAGGISLECQDLEFSGNPLAWSS